MAHGACPGVGLQSTGERTARAVLEPDQVAVEERYQLALESKTQRIQGGETQGLLDERPGPRELAHRSRQCVKMEQQPEAFVRPQRWKTRLQPRTRRRQLAPKPALVLRHRFESDAALESSSVYEQLD